MSLLSHPFVYKTRMKRVIGYRKKRAPVLTLYLAATFFIYRSLKPGISSIKDGLTYRFFPR